MSEEERKRLLTFIVVGGGPTSIEFTSELCDFLKQVTQIQISLCIAVYGFVQDVSKWYKDLKSDYSTVGVEAGKNLLGSFGESLSSHVEKTLATKRNLTVRTNETVKEIKDVSVVLGNGDEIPFGVCVWSTGNAALDFVKDMKDVKLNSHRIEIDEFLRVPQWDGVFAIGDCAANKEKPLAMLAQVVIT